MTTSGLTIKGSKAAVLDASGHQYGIDVESAAPGDLLYDGSGTGNCFAKNNFDTGVPARDRCGVPVPVSEG